MDISVIVPIYGVEKYIEKCLRSLFNQTKTEGVEFILVNDCTKDRSIEIAKEVISEYSNLDVKIIEHEVNKGLAKSRLTGLKVAKGKYTIHIDSDDWCETSMLEDMYNKAYISNADIVIADYFCNSDDSQVYKQQSLVNNYDYISQLIKQEISPNVWNKLVRTSIYQDNIHTFISLVNYTEDLILMIKVFSFAKKIELLNKAYLHYVYRKESMMNSANLEVCIEQGNALIEIKSFLSKKYGLKYDNLINNDMVRHKYQALRKAKRAEMYIPSRLFPSLGSFIFKSYLPFRHQLILYLASKGLNNTSFIAWQLLDIVFKFKNHS